MAERTVMVTGASGFVGSAVLRELLHCGYRVNAIAHRRGLQVQSPLIKVVRGELDDPAVLNEALEGASAAIHLVGIIAENPAHNVTFHRMHVDFTRAVVDACVNKGVQRYVHMSALGARANAPSRYHQSKAAGEAIVQASPLSWTIIRPSLIIGRDGEFTQMLSDWVRGRKAPWFFMPYFGAGFFGQGKKALVQPVAVEDVAKTFVLALEREATVGKRYDLGGPEALTWPGLYRVVSRDLLDREKMSLPIPAWYASLLTRVLPRRLLPFNREQVQMSQEDSVAELHQFEVDFGFRPAHLEDVLAKYRAELGTIKP